MLYSKRLLNRAWQSNSDSSSDNCSDGFSVCLESDFSALVFQKLVNGFKHAFVNPTSGAGPVFRNILPGSSRRNVAVGIAHSRIIHIPTNGALIHHVALLSA